MSEKNDFLRDYYRIQAEWTYQTRNYILRRTGLLFSDEPILEVGCGTGALTAELSRRAKATVIGIDRDETVIKEAEKEATSAYLLLADGENLPFRDGVFSAVVYHFALMWLSAPKEALKEAYRVLRSDGLVVAFAEPDYGASVEYPTEHSLKEAIIKAIIGAGGDPYAARRMPEWFVDAGLKVEDMGLVSRPLFGKRLREAAVARSLFAQTLGLNRDTLQRRLKLEEETPFSFVYYPVFYLVGRR